MSGRKGTPGRMVSAEYLLDQLDLTENAMRALVDLLRSRMRDEFVDEPIAAHNTADATTPPEDAATVVARDTSSAAEPFVDALCREYARRWPTRSDGPNQRACRQLFWDAAGTTVDSDVIHTQMLERARAAAPTPTRTISRERIERYGIRAALHEIGIEIEP